MRSMDDLNSDFSVFDYFLLGPSDGSFKASETQPAKPGHPNPNLFSVLIHQTHHLARLNQPN
jgi:hypothetical protein